MTASVLPLPASHRSMARGRMAANEVRARGGDAMEAAIARIRATFLRAWTLAPGDITIVDVS